MTSNGYVTGWEHQTVRTQRMGGSGTTVVRIPHAIRPGHTADEVPFQAACTAPVHEISDVPFPPSVSLVSPNPPCGLCLHLEA